METLHYKQKLPENSCAVALGFFDGVHKGHQQVLKKLQQQKIPSVVITFEQPPKTILSPEKPFELLCSFPEKMARIAACGIDYVYILPSTKSFLSQSYLTFLQSLKQYVPFTHMVFGPKATFGKNRAGNEKNIYALAQLWGFSVEYIPPYTIDNEIVSSTQIRTLLEKNNETRANNLLGQLKEPISYFTEKNSALFAKKRSVNNKTPYN